MQDHADTKLMLGSDDQIMNIHQFIEKFRQYNELIVIGKHPMLSGNQMWMILANMATQDISLN